MRLHNAFWHIPTVYTLHLAPIPAGFLHRITTWCGHRSIAISKEVGDFLQKAFNVPAQRISYVLNGVDNKQLEPLTDTEKEEVRNRFSIPLNRIVVALHSRITTVKNQMAVAQAVVMLPEAIRNKLLILCSGEQAGSYYNQLQNYINEHDIQSNFCFCGWKNARDVIGASDLLMLPSTQEGFGLNCIEAMFLEVPVVRTKLPGYQDMQSVCVGMDDASPECICKHLRDAVTNYDKYAALVAPAKKFVMSECTVEAMARKTVEVYEKTIEDYG